MNVVNPRPPVLSVAGRKGDVTLDVPDLPGLSPAITGVYNVRRYGAAGDGVADDTAAIDAAIAALTAGGGGVLLFPRGRYRSSGGHAVGVPCVVSGQGQGYFHENGQNNGGYDFEGAAGTAILCSSGTMFLFTFTTPYAEVEGLVVQCTAANPTAGGAFHCVGTGVGGRAMACRYQFRNLTVLDGYYGIEHANGSYSVWENCSFSAQRKYMIYVRDDANSDWGDYRIAGCFFTEGQHATEAAIRWESGGGLKVYGAKIVGGGIGHGLWMVFGGNSNSTQLYASNLSVDVVSGNAVRIETAGNGQFHHALISDSYLTTGGANVEPVLIYNGGAYGSLGHITLDHCQLVGYAAANKPCITLAGNGGINMFIGVVRWEGSAPRLFDKGPSDGVVGGWYAEDNTLAVQSGVKTMGSDAGVTIAARNGDPGFLLYSPSQAAGLWIYTFSGGFPIVRIGGSGEVGFNGQLAQGRAALNGAANDLASAIALVNQIRAALIACGLAQ